MGPEQDPTDGAEGTLPVDRPLPVFLDWLLAGAIAVGGLALLAAGTVLTVVFDRAFLAQGIESGQITVVFIERELSAAEMLSFSHDVLTWTGIGFLVTGLGLVTVAAWYAYAHHAARRRAEAPVLRSSRSVAVIGAAVTAVLSFLPFSPVVGGALAGYLEAPVSGRSIRVGALSGGLAVLPAMVIVAFTTIGLVEGLAAVGEADLGIGVGVVMWFVVLSGLAYGAGLGALGGFLGGHLGGRSP